MRRARTGRDAGDRQCARQQIVHRWTAAAAPARLRYRSGKAGAGTDTSAAQTAPAATGASASQTSAAAHVQPRSPRRQSVAGCPRRSDGSHSTRASSSTHWRARPRGSDAGPISSERIDARVGQRRGCRCRRRPARAHGDTSSRPCDGPTRTSRSRVPPRFEIQAIDGCRRMRSRAARRRNSASIGSISGEWNACETVSGCVRSARAARRAATAATADALAGDDDVAGRVAGGDRHRRRVRGDLALRSSPASPCTDTIAPPAGSACISRPRAAIRRAPSSRLKHAGDAGGGELADAVADDERAARRPSGATAPPARTRARTAPAACSRSASSSDRRCLETAARSSGAATARSSTAAQRSSAARNTGSRVVQLAPHADVLRSLAGEEEGHAPTCARGWPRPRRRGRCRPRWRSRAAVTAPLCRRPSTARRCAKWARPARRWRRHRPARASDGASRCVGVARARARRAQLSLRADSASTCSGARPAAASRAGCGGRFFEDRRARSCR